MPIAKRKVPGLSAFAVLLGLALAVGCHGFFVNPTLTSITVSPPTPTIQQKTTLQMTATGTFDDGSIKTLTGNVFWTTSDPTVVTVSSSGLITAVNTGTATITASSGIATGSTTVTVAVANLVSITITPQNQDISSGNTISFTATGTIAGGGGTVDITTSATWSINPATTGVSVGNGANGGVVTATAPYSSTPPFTVKVQATSGTIVGQTNLTVTQ